MRSEPLLDRSGVEALDVGILVGLARLDETQLDILLLAPLAALMPCLRVNCATGTPASPSFNTATICDSVNGDFFIGLPASTKSCQKSPFSLATDWGRLRVDPSRNVLPNSTPSERTASDRSLGAGK